MTIRLRRRARDVSLEGGVFFNEGGHLFYFVFVVTTGRFTKTYIIKVPCQADHIPCVEYNIRAKFLAVSSKVNCF